MKKIDKEQLKSPEIGSIVTYNGDKKPYDVYIVSGCYLDSTYNRLSNFWYWRKVLRNGNLGRLESGYGYFTESDFKYKIEIKAIKK